MYKKALLILSVIFLCYSFDLSDSSIVDTTNVETFIPKKPIVYKFSIKQDIMPSAWRLTKKAFEEAEKLNADYILIHMNTYGGMVNIADSIRTKLLNSKIPVIVFIDNNAASAGALISIAADSIYMRKGGSIGAATVINQTGEVMPDKYQSYMRSTMRSTAESHGADTIINDNDTIIKWHRDPKIAEAMVDPSVEIPGVIEKDKVLTFTTSEAIKYGFCEGVAENISEVLKNANIEEAEVKSYEITSLERIISFFMNPALQGILIMIIIGGIYFELQSPGIGFPLAASVIAAILYFVPLYLEGLADNWELLVFILGIALLAVELFVIPGFGIAGIAGIVLIITGLTMAMVDNFVFELDIKLAIDAVAKALLIVVAAFFSSLVLALFLGKQLFANKSFKLALNAVQNNEEGYISIDINQKKLIGEEGVAYTVLRPTGKVMINDEIYDAIAEIGFIDKGSAIMVIRDEAASLIVTKKED